MGWRYTVGGGCELCTTDNNMPAEQQEELRYIGGRQGEKRLSSDTQTNTEISTKGLFFKQSQTLLRDVFFSFKS